MKVTFKFDNPFSNHIIPFTFHANSFTKAKAKAIKAFEQKGVKDPEWNWKIHVDSRKVRKLVNKLAQDELIIFFMDDKGIYSEVTKISNHQRLWELKHMDYVILETHFKGEPNVI